MKLSALIQKRDPSEDTSSKNSNCSNDIAQEVKNEFSGVVTATPAIPATDETHRRWLVSFPDSDDMQVLYVDAVTFEKVTADYPEACAAQPMQETDGCTTCAHYARPGLSSGYCSGRDDLPLADGASHPLRKLPSDKGASCLNWELLQR